MSSSTANNIGSCKELIVPGIKHCDPSVILEFMNRFRKNKAACDVILVANDDVEIPVHKAVLVTNAEYFKAMFTDGFKEEAEDRVSFTDVDGAILNLIVDFLYGSTIVITDINVTELLQSSDFFGIVPLKSQCCNFLTRSLNVNNCCKTQLLADVYSCDDLYASCEKFMAKNFLDLIKHERHLELPYSSFKNLLKRDDLNVDLEDKVYSCAINWIKHDIIQRESYLPHLMKYVRLPMIRETYLVEVVAKEPLLCANLKCQLLLNKAFSYKIAPNKTHISGKITMSRNGYQASSHPVRVFINKEEIRPGIKLPSFLMRPRI